MTNRRMKLHEQLAALKEGWSQREMREKRAMMAGAAALGLYLFYAGIVSPLFSHLSDLRHRIVTDQKTLVWMQGVDKQISALDGKAHQRSGVTTPVALLTDLQKEINQAGLADTLTGLKQTNGDAIEVHFQKASFDKMIALLLSVIKQDGAIITQLSAVADATPGRVNADMVIGMTQGRS